jgi:hypothetical protein
MKILNACTFSGIDRDAFAALGHDAVSCDILPTEREGPHYMGDVMDILHDGWDLMVSHAPCTYLANSGVRWLHTEDGRWEKMREGAEFFRAMLHAPIPRLAVENPIMHKYGREIVGRRADQTIQPWQFGHGETKATQLWLRNLPLLKPTLIVPGREPRVHMASPGPDRWKERSRAYLGISAAMALQWGGDEMRVDHALRVKARRSAMVRRGEIGLREVTAQVFHEAVGVALPERRAGGRTVASMLTRYSPEEYDTMITVLSEDGRTGYAITPAQDLVSVFNIGPRGAGTLAIRDAISRGAWTLDCTGPFLACYYREFGFIPYRREGNWTPGEPDVWFMVYGGVVSKPVAKPVCTVATPRGKYCIDNGVVEDLIEAAQPFRDASAKLRIALDNVDYVPRA